MRSPEEVAREIRRLTWDALGNDGLVEEDGPALADLIRARDAEVRAERRNFRSVPEGMVWQDYYSPDEVTQIREQARAEVLAEVRIVADLSEFTWQTAECEEEMEPEGWGCHHDMHCSLPKTERIQVGPGLYEQRDTRPRRLVGPWVKQ